MAKDIDTKIDELATMAEQGFSEMQGEMRELRDNVREVKEVLTTKADKADLERFVGVVRADYDGLAARVKDTEKALP